VLRNSPFLRLPPFDEDSGDLNIIIETPKGSRNKYRYDIKRGLFELSKVLPAGNTFPYDFGYIPSTRGDDGDPLDVLVLMDEPAFTGCRVAGRLIGIIKGEQTEGGEKVRNDRLIAVAAHAQDQRNIESIDQLSPHLLEEIEHFFVSYHALDGETYRLLACAGPEKALKQVHKAAPPKRTHARSHSKVAN
jgi:inorganic pyrophosphatase